MHYKWALLVVVDWIAEDETMILIKFWYPFLQECFAKSLKDIISYHGVRTMVYLFLQAPRGCPPFMLNPGSAALS